MHSELRGGVNIGCPASVSVDELVAAIAGKQINVRCVDGPVGLQSRNFSNDRIYTTGWKPSCFLKDGIAQVRVGQSENAQIAPMVQ